MNFILLVWLIDIASLCIFAIAYTYWSIVEGVFFELPSSNSSLFWSILLSLFLMITFAFFGIKGSTPCFYLIGIIVIGWMLYPLIIFRERRDTKRKKMKNLQQLQDLLKKEGEGFSILKRLARTYEEMGKLKEALDYYKKASSFINTELPLEVTQKIREIEYHFKIEEEEKPFICRHCGAKNRKDSLFCKKCGRIIHSSFIAYLRNYAPLPLKIGIIWLILSALFFGFGLNLWANIIFYFLVAVNFFVLRRMTAHSF